MSLPIFGAGKKRKPLVGGSSMPKEKRMADIKLSSRRAKSSMEFLPTRSESGKKIVGSETP